jgi:hypothetical protein
MRGIAPQLLGPGEFFEDMPPHPLRWKLARPLPHVEATLDVPQQREALREVAVVLVLLVVVLVSVVVVTEVVVVVEVEVAEGEAGVVVLAAGAIGCFAQPMQAV